MDWTIFVILRAFRVKHEDLFMKWVVQIIKCVKKQRPNPAKVRWMFANVAFL